MSAVEQFDYNLFDEHQTVPQIFSETVDGLMQEFDEYTVSTLYEDRYITLLHLFSKANGIGKKDYHLAYKAYGARDDQNKSGIVLSNVLIPRDDYPELNYPREKSLRHYSLEKLLDSTETVNSKVSQSEKNSPLQELESIIGAMLVDNYAVRREDRCYDSVKGLRPLLAGKILYALEDDAHEDNLQTFFEDICEIKNSEPIKASGAGSFHKIKNLTRNIEHPTA